VKKPECAQCDAQKARFSFGPLFLVVCAAVNAQQASTALTSAVVPRLVNSGQSGGAPLWMEAQNVNADAKGNYVVQLGETSGSALRDHTCFTELSR
jgi:hypothetical protein